MVRWEQGRRSDNVQDNRRRGPKTLAMGGGGISIVMLIILFIVYGGDLRKVMQFVQQQNQGGGAIALPGGGGGEAGEFQTTPEEEEMVEYVKVILGYTEDVWTEIFAEEGMQYEPPVLELFRGQVQSACGVAGASAGPFYCPGDQKVYIDLAFYDELKRRFGAPGDFAQAYVIAHEVGHHVQNLLGITDKVHSQNGRISKEEYNQLSVRLELQADYLAGAWAARADKKWRILERGDVEEGLNAANAIGDDTLQKQAQGYVVEESFTHGSSDQRVRWFRKGLENGDLSEMDTFSIRNL